MYIAGESYAGTYIPYFTTKILELNKQKQKVKGFSFLFSLKKHILSRRKQQYNLQGIAIGNGWISAEHQYNAYYDYSIANNLISPDRVVSVFSLIIIQLFD